MRAIWGGCVVVRTALYLAAMSGVRCNPTRRTCSRRLVAAGRPRGAALTAGAHTRLAVLNTMARAHPAVAARQRPGSTANRSRSLGSRRVGLPRQSGRRGTGR